MKLNYDQIKSITVGALWSEQKPDGIHFYKCTQKQIEAWDALSKDFYTRVRATTGIRLDFYTNSKTVRFGVSSGKYELHVNNLLRDRFLIGSESSPENQEIVFSVCDPFGAPLREARVTLYFPSHACGCLRTFELDDGAYVKPVEYDCKLLMIGDSITQGWDSEYDSFTYAYQLSRTLNANSVIQGIGGAVYHESTLDDLPFDPDIITIAYGTNDFNRYKTYEVLREHVASFLDGIIKLYPNKKIFVFSPIWREKTTSSMGKFEECRAVIIEEIEKRELIHVDGLSMVPPIPALFSDEWLHPNALGFGFFGENATREILKHLK